MFQPQPTYYADFVYGATTQPSSSQNNYLYDSIPGQQNHQQQGQLRSRGLVSFSTPNFSAAPTGLWGSIGEPQLQIPERPVQRHQLRQQQYDTTDIIPKMEVDDEYEAQQALANGYAPSLEVSEL